MPTSNRSRRAAFLNVRGMTMKTDKQVRQSIGDRVKHAQSKTHAAPMMSSTIIPYKPSSIFSRSALKMRRPSKYEKQ